MINQLLPNQFILKDEHQLIGANRIQVIYDAKNKDLFARVNTGRLENSTRYNHLPIVKVDKRIFFVGLEKMQQYFNLVHLTLEKGIDGLYNRVSVHISGNGGGKGTIPFESGLALGSIVSADTIEKMEKFAEIETRESDFENLIKQLLDKIQDTEHKEKNNSIKELSDFYKQRKENLLESFKSLLQKAEKPKEQVPLLNSFTASLESPIDFGKSKMEVQPRGFDTFQHHSEYFNMQEELSSISEKAKSSTTSTKASLGGSYWFVRAKGSVEHSSSVSKRLSEIHQSGKSKGVLMINSNFTTRHVRCLTDIKFDKIKLGSILEKMSSQTSPDKLKKMGIMVDQSGNKSIFVLTEAVLGGTFTALVSFNSSDKLDRKAENFDNNNQTKGSAEASLKFVPSNIKGSAQHERSNREVSKNDDLQSSMETNITIDLLSQGALPSFTANEIEQAIMKHASKDFSKNMSEKNTAMTSDRDVKESKTLTSVHNQQSVSNAYDSFIRKITKDKDCGIPVGFHYQEYTEQDLRKILKEMKQ